ncbi:hypothetical protein NMG60_11037220 [Bertholletia excelsa]
MAISNFDSNHRTACLLGLFGLLMLVQRGGAFQFKVGGNGNWSVPPDPNAKWYNQWAENNRFQIGDTLMFVYPSDKDTVLEVTEADFANCNTAHPIATYTDGHTVVQFNHSGPYYFISGVKENCQKNEKIVVIVMADRSKLTNGTGSASPPSPEMAAPSPAPSGEESPSPPPQITGEGNPSPAPVAEQAPPPPNGASPLTLSFVGSVGALLGWSLLLVS